MNKKQAIEVSGLVSVNNSKMPGSSYPVDPFSCKTGSKFRIIPGSVCSKCYAIRLAKFRANVGNGWVRNQHAIKSADREAWIAGIVYQIEKAQKRTGEPFHRWLDAGDLDSVETLDRIMEACKRTPKIKHWIPTREIGIVRSWIGLGNTVPSNAVIRLSSTMIDDPPRKSTAKALGRGIACSTVHATGSRWFGHKCPARNQGNACVDCRACWDRRVRNVSYPAH